MTKDFNKQWDFLIRKSIRKYIVQYPALKSIYEDLYQECYAAILKRKEKASDFIPTPLFVHDIARRYIMAQKMFSSPKVKHINTTEIGKTIDNMSDTTIEFDDIVKIEDPKSRYVFEDIETMVDWELFNGLQTPIDARILQLRLEGKGIEEIAKILALHRNSVSAKIAKMKNSYKEWLKAS